MKNKKFEDHLSEKQKLEDFLKNLENDLSDSLDDFEKVDIDKLTSITDDINDNLNLAKLIGNEFYDDFLKFSKEFNFFVKTFEEVKRINLDKNLEEFLDNVQILQKDLLDLELQ